MGHKGQRAIRAAQQRCKAVRQGRASRWIALYPVSEAIRKAGLA